MIREIWQQRTLIWAFVKRDLKGRFAGSTVGFLWTVIHPLAMIIVYTVIFSQIMGGKHPDNLALGRLDYVVYLCAAILPWLAMQETLIRACSLFIEHASMIKKVAFHPIMLVVYISVTGLINLLISFSVFFAVMLLTGAKFGLYLLLLPVSLAIMFLFLLTMSIWLSCINVFFRDTQQIVSIFLTVWFWVTPIVYRPQIIPEGLKFITEINPLNYLMNLFRDPVYANQFYHWREAILFTSATVMLLILGLGVFKKLRKHIPDEI